MSVRRRNFPGSFKREAVDRVANSGLTAGAVAGELGLHETVLRRWMTQFGVQATGTTRRPRRRRTCRSNASAPRPA
ncbi:hypothetical protein BREVUG8_10399 [Brevundimonas sp. G8]|nr:hypothetical protein BREVUG8_10399 [Brevundimonas sp. G8]